MFHFLSIHVFPSLTDLCVPLRAGVQVLVRGDHPRHQPLQSRRAEGSRGSGSAPRLPGDASGPGAQRGPGE